ncbi:hypothetical protein BpHYR1_049949 [Brachionus plicatilis]|uniref:Uncharacterized protein n=1 Tax=Brachionus plicatilis TaxID=10195 RepID=A0A3M7P7T5_BRAPC|nr:hypothetical protein BpHYR1_049949 [Brachionus plicatilis]
MTMTIYVVLNKKGSKKETIFGLFISKEKEIRLYIKNLYILGLSNAYRFSLARTCRKIKLTYHLNLVFGL